MRSENIAHARVGKLELRFGDSPVPPSSATPGPALGAPPPADPEALDDDERDALDARAELETLLHSSGVSVDAFLPKKKAADS